MRGDDAAASAGALVNGVRTQVPASLEELRALLSAAHASGHAVLPVGCGSKWFLRPPPQRCDVMISTRNLCTVVAHEAADMTVTVGAGITLAELNATLGRVRQYLPLDPPIPKDTTIGSAIATDACGPLRLSQGKVRDLLIGITAVLVNGTIVKGGGRVVKNVAGYDLMKLLTGSHGTLAVIAEATFKLRPLPEAQADFVVQRPTLADALDLCRILIEAPMAPLYLVALNPTAAGRLGFDGATVQIGCGGSPVEVDAQRERLSAFADVRKFTGAIGTSRYAGMRDLPSTTLSADVLGAKISVLRTRLAALLADIEADVGAQGRALSIVAHAGVGVAFLRIADASSAMADAMVARTRAAGGWVTFDAVPETLRSTVAAMPMLPPGIELMRGIKRSLDPQNLLSPGTFVGGI